MKNENSEIPDAPMARPCCHTHPDVEHVNYTEPKRKTRASVRLTEEAHMLLLDMADENEVSMKHVGSEAIFTLDRAPKAEKMYRERIAQLKFEALKFKESVIFYALLIGVGMGMLGFILGVSV